MFTPFNYWYDVTQIVIGCDGIRSQLAQWMGFPEPKYAGHCAIRGMAVYNEEQPHQPQVSYIYGRGIRAGFVPVSPTKVYWFICYNRSSPGLANYRFTELVILH